jgi:hypothetical protein
MLHRAHLFEVAAEPTSPANGLIVGIAVEAEAVLEAVRRESFDGRLSTDWVYEAVVIS